MKSKILVDLERLKYPNSGIANVFRNLGKILDKSLDITLYIPKKETINFKNYKILIQKSLHKYFPFVYVNYKIIHVSHQLSSYFHFKFFHQKKVLTLHDLNFLHENLSDFKKAKTIININRNIKNADVIVCISDFVKKDFLKNINLFKIKTNPRVEVVHNGIDFPVMRINDFEQYRFLKNKKFILNIGVLYPKKNQLSILEMMKYIDDDVVLVSADINSSYEKKIVNCIKENNLEHRVHFFKCITEEEKVWLLQNCKALVHPSIAEGFGVPPIEAMFFGKPVFLSNLTSLPEIGGDLAFYFQNFDAIHMSEVYKEGMNRYEITAEEYSEKLEQRAKIFSTANMVEGYGKIYKSLLK